MSLPASLILDPAEVANDRVELDLESGSIRIATEGPSFGQAEVKQYLAAAALGQIPVDYSVDNRQLEIPLILGDEETESFEEAREALEQKVALFQREGGWLKFEADSGSYFVDVVSASLRHGRGSLPILSDLDPDVVLALDFIPEIYGESDVVEWVS